MALPPEEVEFMSVYLGKDQEEEIVLKTYVTYKEMKLEAELNLTPEELEILVEKAKELDEDSSIISKTKTIKKIEFC